MNSTGEILYCFFFGFSKMCINKDPICIRIDLTLPVENDEINKVEIIKTLSHILTNQPAKGKKETICLLNCVSYLSNELNNSTVEETIDSPFPVIFKQTKVTHPLNYNEVIIYTNIYNKEIEPYCHLSKAKSTSILSPKDTRFNWQPFHRFYSLVKYPDNKPDYILVTKFKETVIDDTFLNVDFTLIKIED